MRKDMAQSEIAQSRYDVRRVIGPKTTPYMFWKNWSAACGRNEFGLVFDMLLPNGELAEKFKTAEDFFANINEIGLPYEPRWTLDKIKLTNTQCLYMCHRSDSDDKNADIVVSMMTLQRTELGYRVENIQRIVSKPSPEFILSFDLFNIPTTEGDYLKKLASGWKRPDLSDESTRYVAPAED